jgi:hypothetical protein
MNTAGMIALYLGLAGCLAFLVPYLLKVKGWWRETHRAHVVAFSGVVFGFFLLYVLRALVDPDVFQWIRLALLWALALVCVWRAVIFNAGIRRERRALAAAGDVP